MPIEYIPHPIRAIKTDVTGARAFGVTYWNLTLRPIQAVITMRHTVNLINSRLFVIFSVVGTNVGRSGYFNTPAAGIAMEGMLVGNVAPGESYVLMNTNPGGVNTIMSWIEVAQ